MTSLPYPCFIHESPVNATENRAALAAVGRCRFDPATCCDPAEYRAICGKNREQALVDTDAPETKDENKKLKKKFMKEGVAMASTFLQDTLQLDVSVVDLQIVVAAEDIIGTDGCLAACLLDAGCAAIVMDATNTEAMNAAKIPRDRLVAHFDDATRSSSEAVSAALSLAGTISIGIADNSLDIVDTILAQVQDKEDKVSFQLATMTKSDDVPKLVSEISKKCKDGKGSIGLIDPTAMELGLSYAACMKTDREDGLFTTVVCTRTDEALGLVYSSKVGA